MAPRQGQNQASFTGGVVDATLIERSDLEIYARGMASARNLEVLPQGGVRNADGTVELGLARGALQAITPASNTLAGGTATGNRTLGTMTFSAALQLAAFDITDITCTPATGTYVVETSNGGASWAQLGPTVTLETKTRSRRFALAPGSTVLADRVRVRVIDASAVATTITLGGSAAWTQSSSVPPARVRSFTSSRDAVYDFVYTPLNIDVWGYDGAGADVWLAAIPSPLTAAYIETQAADGTFETFTFTQSLDTEILFHKDVQPWRIFRLGTDTDWDARAVSFTNMPLHDYGGTYSGVTDIWEVELVNWTSAAFGVLTIAGEDSIGFQLDPAALSATRIAAIKAAVESAPNVKAGVTVTNVAGQRYRVEFTGTGNEGPWTTFTGRVGNLATAAISCTRLQRGIAGGEAIMSSTKGWPRCGCFWQQRLIMGGLKNLPSTLLVSVTGEFFNLDTTRAQADNGLVLPLDVDADEVISRVYPGRHLQVFTSSGEYWFSDRAVDATQPQTVVLGTRNGIAGHVPVSENEGTTVYVHNNRAMVLEFQYSNEQQNYDSLNFSLLSSSQVKDVRDAAMQKASVASDANRLLLVDGQGQLIVYSLLRAQNIQAPVPRVTDGTFVSITVNGRNEPTVLVKRAIGGVQTLLVERIRAGTVLDQSVTSTPSGTAVTGLTRHEGATVWAIADRSPVGPFTVTAGAITLPVAASTAIVGRWTAPAGETLDLPTDVGPRVVATRRRRVHTVRCSLSGTTSMALAANGGALFDVPLRGHDADLDVAELDAPFTGDRVLSGLPGWTYGGRVRFGQLRPGKFVLRSLISEAD
jgi:hypothetical protein